jgi:hypothetical protein
MDRSSSRRRREPTDRGDAAQDSSQGSTQDVQDHANAQVLMAQQVMAEQSKRMADFMFWQLILGVALLIGVCVTIYYARQIARAAVNVGPRALSAPKALASINYAKSKLIEASAPTSRRISLGRHGWGVARDKDAVRCDDCLGSAQLDFSSCR